MITIINQTRTILIDQQGYCKKAQTMLSWLGYDAFDLGIVLTTNRTIRTYNRDYRNKDKATDILSFPFHPSLTAGQTIIPQSSEERNLGDIIISLEFVKKDASHWGQTFEQRMDRLLAHGICHLLGYDHQTDSEYHIMLKKERELLTAIQSNVSV